MQLEQLIKFGQNDHGNLVKIEIKSTKLFLPEYILIFLIDSQYQQQSIQIESAFHGISHMIQKDVETGSEYGSK
jgi:hypothetical protein